MTERTHVLQRPCFHLTCSLLLWQSQDLETTVCCLKHMLIWYLFYVINLATWNLKKAFRRQQLFSACEKDLCQVRTLDTYSMSWLEEKRTLLLKHLSLVHKYIKVFLPDLWSTKVNSYILPLAPQHSCLGSCWWSFPIPNHDGSRLKLQSVWADNHT